MTPTNPFSAKEVETSFWRGPCSNGHGEVQRCEMAASQVIAEITCRQTENAGLGFHVPTTFFNRTP
jgi:hypothetical protein